MALYSDYLFLKNYSFPWSELLG